MARQRRTIDPRQIQDPSQIPPPGAHPVGLSPQGLVDVYCGTLLGDVDALPSAKELLGAAPDTGGLSNADYVYNKISALYGGAQLPVLQNPSGNVKVLVFVSGSSQGGYGAFHISRGPQDWADFDRIVVDSLNLSGDYSAGSGLGSAIAPLGEAPDLRPGLLAPYYGPADLLGITYAQDPRLEGTNSEDIRAALAFTAQSIKALTTAVEARNASAVPQRTSSHATYDYDSNEESVRRLVRANQDMQGLMRAAARASSGRQYLSTALLVAELVESFQMVTQNADPGKTDGEAVSRVVGFKLTPEVSLIPGFNSAVVQHWWRNGHQDFVTNNSEGDTSPNGNGAGIMFLEFLNDYLGIPLDKIIQHMPKQGGAPLGQTYVSLLNDNPRLADVAGRNGASAFQKMVSLLEKSQNPDGTLNLPANGNPFPGMPGARQGGLFAATHVGSGSLAQDIQGALQLLTQLEQQVVALKGALEQIQRDVSAGPTAINFRTSDLISPAGEKDLFGYGPSLAASVVANLEHQVAPYRAPQYDQTLQHEFWPHVYNELPGTGTKTNRLQVITGTTPAPEAVQITGTIRQTKLEPDGDLHISFQPDDPKFPTNHGPHESPLEIEIIYAGPVTQHDAEQAKQGYTNPFDISRLTPGTRIQVAGPVIFDRAHGKADTGGTVQSGLEIHPVVGVTVLSGGAPGPIVVPPVPGTLSTDLASALGQAGALGQTLGSLTSLLQKMKGEAPTS